jgi:ribonuclease HI
MGVKNLEVKSDSQVMVGHVKREYEARGEKMKRYLEKVKEIMESFDKVTFTKIPWEDNSAADALTRIASAIEEEVATSDHSVQELAMPSIGRADQVACIEGEQGDPEVGTRYLAIP